jgi:Kef-type K+ transport system membrane component KefB
VAVGVAEALALIAMAASPAVLSRVVMDTRASGPVTERALALTTLSALYALTLVSARAGVMHHTTAELGEMLFPALVVLGVSFVVGGLLALVLRSALRFMSPTSENTSMLLIATIAAASTIASHFGGSAPLAGLIGGLLLKQLHPRPWAWPRQLGTASSLLTMLMFVLVSVVAAKAPWNPEVAGLVLAFVITRAVAKIAGVSAANWNSGTTWRQAIWTGCTLSPMSSVALLMVSQFATTSPDIGPGLTSIALPAILLMEVLGAMGATFALHRARETSLADAPDAPQAAMREARG